MKKTTIAAILAVGLVMLAPGAMANQAEPVFFHDNNDDDDEVEREPATEQEIQDMMDEHRQERQELREEHRQEMNSLMQQQMEEMVQVMDHETMQQIMQQLHSEMRQQQPNETVPYHEHPELEEQQNQSMQDQ